MSGTRIMFSSKKFTTLSTAFLLACTLTLTGCNSNNVAEFQAEGKKLMEEGNPNGAIVFFKNALDEDANNFELRHDLVKAYIQSGKRVQAEAELKKCLVQQPTNTSLLLTAANFFTNPRDAEQALAYIEQVEKLQAATAETREIYGTNLRFLDRVDEAKKAYKEAIALDSTRIPSKINLSTLYLAEGNTQEGLKLINEILAIEPNHLNALQLSALISEESNDYAAAEASYRKIITLLPTDINPVYALGELLIKQGKIEEAEAIHSDMTKNFKSNPSEYALAGMLAFQKQDFEAASKLFQQSVNIAPSVNGLYYLASSLHQIGNSESALSNLRRILDVEPNNVQATLLTAQILTSQSRLQEAEYELKKLIKASPESAQAYSLLGEVQKALGNSDEALASFAKALEIAPENTQATMSRTSILMEQNKSEIALAELQKAMEINSESIAIRTALYNYHMQQNNIEEAMKIVDEGLVETPNHSLFLTMKAGAYMALEENEKAIELLKQTTSQDSSFLPAIELLSNIYIVTGENEAALQLADSYLEQHPESQDFLVNTAVILDNLDRKDEATARLEKANALNSERALISLVRRALNAGDKAKAEKYLTDKYAAFPVPQVRVLLSNYYNEQGELDKALAIFSTEELNKTPEAILARYRLYTGAKNYTAALAEAENLIALFPQSNDGYVIKAFTLENDDKFDEAFTTLEEAYKKLQSNELMIQLGNLCLRDNRYDKALSYFRTSILKDPKNKDALSGQAYALLQEEKVEEAVASYEKILELYPQDLANINNLAMALAKSGHNTSRAVELATQVFAKAPENEGVIDTYAFALLADNQISEAMNIIKSGLSTHPNSAVLNYRHGMALLAENNKVEAIKALEKSLELGDFSESTHAQQLIDENK